MKLNLLQLVVTIYFGINLISLAANYLKANSDQVDLLKHGGFGLLSLIAYYLDDKDKKRSALQDRIIALAKNKIQANPEYQQLSQNIGNLGAIAEGWMPDLRPDKILPMVFADEPTVSIDEPVRIIRCLIGTSIQMMNEPRTMEYVAPNQEKKVSHISLPSLESGSWFFFTCEGIEYKALIDHWDVGSVAL